METKVTVKNTIDKEYLNASEVCGAICKNMSARFAARWATIAGSSDLVFINAKPKIAPAIAAPIERTKPPAIKCIEPNITALNKTAVVSEKLFCNLVVIIARQSISSVMGAEIKRAMTIKISPK